MNVEEEAKNREAKKIKLQVSDGAAIDPEALEEVPVNSKIITDQTTSKLYSSMMTAIDIKKDKNSYYKLQAMY